MTYSLFVLLAVSASYALPSLTIYNDDFAVVRQEVPMQLLDGINEVSFDQVTADLEPDSVVLRDPSGLLSFQILEQNYRNDPVSQFLLLEHFKGQKIQFEMPDGELNKLVEGKVLRSGYSGAGRSNASDVMIEMEGQIRFGLPGKPLFPSLGEDSILRPTLSWTLNGKAGEGSAQLSYLTGGLSWKADYNLIVEESSDSACLNGWVTLTNESGTRFTDAQVQLLAGDVHKVKERGVYYEKSLGADDPFASEAMLPEPQVSQKELDSYHLYSVGRSVTLMNKETKQVQFLTSDQVKAEKSYLYDPMKWYRYSGGKNTLRGPAEGFPSEVSIYWTFQNEEENGLGVPMPKGKIRLYQKSADNQLEFLGDNLISHTPQKEEVSFYTGNAFDLVGERRVTDFRYRKGDAKMAESVEITLRNRSSETVTIHAREVLYRWMEWQISEPSDEFEKLDSQVIRFSARLEPDEEKTITYTVNYSW